MHFSARQLEGAILAMRGAGDDAEGVSESLTRARAARINFAHNLNKLANDAFIDAFKAITNTGPSIHRRRALIELGYDEASTAEASEIEAAESLCGQAEAYHRAAERAYYATHYVLTAGGYDVDGPNYAARSSSEACRLLDRPLLDIAGQMARTSLGMYEDALRALRDLPCRPRTLQRTEELLVGVSGLISAINALDGSAHSLRVELRGDR